ncbi:Alanyl-transfer RNA synthetase domain protein [Sulfitobacter noctilucicola]|uniref:Alanine--tRNA ligase n=1 Tax=Sulfitobacter noctilucicola TaxID=1342301 RepID=A0A7W6M7I8_9RHOB|nr:alanyl-tRNA editing protein [Sulfitobacter noctilucicola]KIN64980.1 Alanyl-transfer RNA synthetase domain protein [Sulfitobacter noctilucicola]MBB4173879.1 misacylated tRNA(Ala) deacylase [Sulfitobacter noctilucicola]
MTTTLFRTDAYQREAPAMVASITAEGGIVLDQSLFYPTGGGQPGDSGWISWDGKHLPIATTVKGDGDEIVAVPAEPQALPPLGAHVTQTLDWDRRHKHMRVHTALHLLSVVVPFGVTGGQISATHGRLDFDMPDAPEDRDAIEHALNEYTAQDLLVSEAWMTAAELDANPHLVKTMAVKPPKSAGDIRLIQIGEEGAWIDLQPCGGTHVARTGEIGALRLGKIEKKGRMNRRIYLHLDS